MAIGSVLAQLIGIYVDLVVLDIILSWVLMGVRNPGVLFNIKRLLDQIVEPALMPIRRATRPYTGSMPLDFSPIVLIILLEILQALVQRVFGG